jgi:hypothetical protein
MNSLMRFAALALVATSFVAPRLNADTISFNSGSLGAVANGTNTATVVLDVPGPLAGPYNLAASYSGGARTTIPYLPALNPAASSPFSIEFWAMPTASDNDDAPVANRVATGNRSGWVFFQRNAATGWNFRMYDGVGSNLGWDLTGGTATLNAWSHVVATWNGSAAKLYVNGALADDVNAAGISNNYNPSTSAIFAVGSLFDGGSASTATIDEVAYYGSELSLSQIAAHYAAASNPAPGAYANLVLGDGAMVYLQAPEPSSIAMLVIGVGVGGFVARRKLAARTS